MKESESGFFFSIADLHLFHTFYLTGAVTEKVRENMGEGKCTDHSQTLTQLEPLREKKHTEECERKL